MAYCAFQRARCCSRGLNAEQVTEKKILTNGLTKSEEYYSDENHGDYVYVTLEEMVNNYRELY
jgi:hypothetical protein